ncbi:MAG: hypothetical protein KJ623_04495, partial [Nanoarchaeota archaeon]|nr:hypothetical protein [Nanoarchaeota archaeon]
MKLIKTKAIFEMILIICVTFTIYLMSVEPVRADDYGCCEKIGNKFCEPGYQSSCDQSNGYLFVPGTSCASTDVCKTGTCFIDGQCFANYPK